MSRSEIEQKLIAIICQEKQQIPEDLLQPGTLLADAGIDSLDSLTILFGIEEQFGISISDERARAMRTFGDMLEAIDEQLRAARSSGA